MYIKNKKGDASIVATVILIISAIAVAVVVTTFSKESEEKVGEKIVKLGESIECEDVRLSVENFEEPAKFTLMNRGTLGIDRFVVRSYEAGKDPNVFDFEDFSDCVKGSLTEQEFGVKNGRLLPQGKCVLSSITGTPNKIELIPFISNDNEELGCENRISIWEK